MSRLTHSFDAISLNLLDDLYSLERDQDTLEHDGFVSWVEDYFGSTVSDAYENYYEENE